MLEEVWWSKRIIAPNLNCTEYPSVQIEIREHAEEDIK
jgi:hypothetical protein